MRNTLIALMLLHSVALAQQSFQGITVSGGTTADSPKDVQGLYAWWAADGPIVIDATAPSNSVSQIIDITGNGHHLSQSTKANQPFYLTNIINGRPSLSFDGGDRLSGTDGITNVFSGNDIPFSMVYVIYVDSTANESSLTWGNQTNAVAQFIVYRPSLGSGANIVFRGTRADDTATAVNMNLNGSTNGFFMIQAHSFSGTAFTSRILSSLTNVYNSGAVATGVTTVNTFTMGALNRNGAFAQHLVGKIPEAMLYDRGITTNEQNTVIRYLQKKYNIVTP